MWTHQNEVVPKAMMLREMVKAGLLLVEEVVLIGVYVPIEEATRRELGNKRRTQYTISKALTLIFQGIEFNTRL